MTKRVLDLCCGTGSVAKWAREYHGHESVAVVGVDIAQVSSYAPLHIDDVTTWAYADAYGPGHFDIVHASPPCTEYSQAKTIGVRDFATADRIAEACLKIIDYFAPPGSPVQFTIENPRGSLLWKRPFFRDWCERRGDVGFVDACYCQYGYPWRKPTRFATNRADAVNAAGVANRMCDAKTCPACFEGPSGRRVHRVVAQRGIGAIVRRIEGQGAAGVGPQLASIPTEIFEGLYASAFH
jgi:hypothetical protein